MKSLILSDLDFTLLRSDLSISDYTKKVWSEASKRSKLSIATARSYAGIRELLGDLLLTEPLILLDGAVIASPDGNLLHMSAIDKETGDEIIETIASQIGLYPLLVSWEDGCEQFIYPKDPCPYQQELLNALNTISPKFASDRPVAGDKNLKIVYLSSKEQAGAIKQALDDKLGKNIEIKSAKDPYMDCHFTTILHPEGDKAHALAKLEEIEEVDIAHTTVFGDNHNDIGMFKLAGTKIAVSNAIDELKELADIVLPHTNDEDAVAKYLKDKIL